jgi:hypothetical protein
MNDLMKTQRGTVLVHDMGATVTVIGTSEFGLRVALPSRPDAEGTILHAGQHRWQVQSTEAAVAA